MNDSDTKVIDPIEKINENEKLYLVETKAPLGYNKLAGPVEVQLVINDAYTQPPGSENENDTSGTKPSSGLYDWKETATLRIADGANISQTNAAGEIITNSGMNADSNTATVYYRIANNPGVELPSAGGPGTTWMYIIGLMLTVDAGIALVSRRRVRSV